MGKDTWQGLDKVQHLILFLWLSFVLTGVFGWVLSLFICLICGFVIEKVEMSNLWGKFMKMIGENEGKADSISWKDIITNCVGTVMGILAYWVI